MSRIHPADLRREWQRKQERRLERETQLDLFVDLNGPAQEALEKLKELHKPIVNRSRVMTPEAIAEYASKRVRR